MRVTITALKAPWPEGSRVGSVVELEGDTIPAWAVGKCTSVVAGGGGSGPPTLPSAELEAQLAAAQEEVAALRAMLAGGGGSGPPTLPNAAPEAPARRRG